MNKTISPPYYAVIFSSTRTGIDDGYVETDSRMLELAEQQPGFLGVDSARNADRTGITVSYWKDLHSIQNWKKNLEHLEAQKSGRAKWYSRYRLEVALVEKSYNFEKK